MVFLLASVSRAQIGDPQQIFSPELNTPNDISLADLDNDGRMDVVSNSREDGSVVWYRNKGGSFSEQRIITESEPGIIGLETTDIDSDGDQDVLVLSVDNHSLVWYENDDQSFATRHVIDDQLMNLGYFMAKNNVLARDVNVDGNQDIILVSSDTSLVWYENEGGSFKSPHIIENEFQGFTRIRDVTTGELTKHNLPDIVYATRDGIYWHKSNGSGYSSDSTFITSNSCFCDYDNVHLVDLNQDGNLDLLTTENSNTNGGEVRWHEYQNGDFVDSELIKEYIFDEVKVMPADVNFDGDMDIAVYDYGTITSLEWIENTASGFSEPKEFFEGERRFYGEILVADMDGDTDQDVVHVDHRWNRVDWIENLRQGRFERRPVSRYPSFNGLQNMVTADFTDNGMMDVAMTFSATKQIAWMQQTDQGFSFPRVIDHIEARALASGDMDGDGIMDLLVSTTFDSLKIYLNSGTDLGGRFTNEVLVTDSAFRANNIHVEDLDDDGDMDIVTTEFGAARLAWYENLTTGFSAPRTISKNVSRAGNLTTKDMDGDGDLDILVAVSSSGEIAWFKNQNNSLGDRFGSKILVSDSASIAADVDAADLDNDGDLDIISASRGDDKLAWYENQGTQFGSQQLLMDPGLSKGANHISIADLNDDGLKDIVARHDSATVWFTNEGEGNFTDPGIIHDFTSISIGLEIVDMDGDQVPDLLTGYTDRDQVIWFKNEFTFTPIPTEDPVTVESFQLSQNYPNPFNPSTRINFHLPRSSNVTLTVYNLLGQRVATVVDEFLTAGSHAVTFDGGGLSSGVYAYRLKSDGHVRTRKMLLLK